MLCNCICILTGLYDKIHKNQTGYCCIFKGEIRTRSEAEKETYSETQLNINRRRGAVLVPKVIRTDQTDH